MFDLKQLPNPIPDEHIVFFLRRHPITMISLIAGYLFLMGAPFAVILYVQTMQPLWLESQTTVLLFVLGGSLFFLFAWLFLFQAFMDFYLDIWIVTNRRILNIEQTGLFSRTISELRLYRIQDVTSTINGFLHTMFNFGNVEIQSAGEKTRFCFEEIRDPNHVSKTILELAETDRREHLDEAVEEFAMPDIDKKSAGSAA